MYWLPVLLGLMASRANAQGTMQTSVAPELRECYSDPLLINRNNYPPATVSILIDIIRKLEDHPNVNKDLRQIAVALLHTYRQDGIEYHQPESNVAQSSNNILPYAATFNSFHRHRLLLSRLIPNNNNEVFENTTLSSTLKCAIHFMLSTTVDARVRGNENNCNQFSQYRALRTARQAPTSDDVEILDSSILNAKNRMGKMRQYNPKNDVETTYYNGPKSARQLVGDSTCPIQTGVVKTAWGDVSFGSVIAGIAAASETQRVSVQTLAGDSIVNQQDAALSVLSIYPATLTGDLAEAILVQRTERANPSISIGAAGNWNSTEANKFYMLHNRINIEMTDPEIRGDIDGFILGTTRESIWNTFSTLKLSQLLDMYYTPRNGVFNPVLRACNRRALATTEQYITEANLLSETYAFTVALDTKMPLRATITGGFSEYVTSAVTNFMSYTSSNLNDLNCVTTESVSSDYRLKTNLYIVLDASWQYDVVYPAISHIVDSIEVNKYGSSVAILSAFDGSVVINTTYSPADFHSEYTLARHQSMFTGVNLQTSFTNIRTMMQEVLRNETAHNYVGGNSSVLLFLLNTGNLQNNDQVLEQARILNETVPDLRILFATSSNQHDNLWNLVRDMHNDIKTVTLTSTGSNVDTLTPVISRIQEVGRRIINPLCGSTYPSDTLSGTRQFDDFVEPGYINFYSVSPNYFYVSNDNRRIRISRTGAALGTLIICHSRSVVQPRQNATSLGFDQNAITCQEISTSGNVEISLQNACDGYSTINSCPFFYLSVQSSMGSVTTTSAICTDEACRFPYNIRYQVQIQEFGCFSSASNVGAGLILVLVTMLVNLHL